MSPHIVTLVVRKVCDVLKVVATVSGVMFVHHTMRGLQPL